MKSRYSKQETKEGMQIGTKLNNNSNNNNQLKDREPHLSGAYIRSLVKQLTSSRTKEYPTTMDPKDDSSDSSVVVDGDCFPPVQQQGLTKLRGVLSESHQQGQQTQQKQPPQPQQQQQPPPHKKQVRRRLHTSRPYQERLLNMAEARREIVTALKFHRAAMKQAQEQQQQQHQQQQNHFQEKQQPQPLNPPTHQPCFDQGNIKPRSYQTISHPSTTPNFSNYLDNLPYSSFPYPPPSQPSHFWPVSPISPLPSVESLSFILPNQPLGLNLNFQDFDNLSTTLYHNGNNNNPSIYSSSSPSSSASPSPSAPADQELPQENSHPVVAADVVSESGSPGGGGNQIHQVVDDEEMAEIRSLGEQHQMEWNDTVNLMTSAWWFKFLKGTDIGPELKAEDDVYQPFDQVMEIPAWLNAPDCSLQQHLNDCFSKDYFEESALPCMDIEEIEGIDGEWLS